MNIPILDITRQYKSIKPEIDAAIQRVVESGRFILGPEVEALEHGIAEKYGVKHAIGVASGTDALLLSLKALGIGPGDQVIVPSFTFFATAGVVYNVGATPIFADIDPDTYNLDPADIRRILQDAARGKSPVASGNVSATDSSGSASSPTGHKPQATDPTLQFKAIIPVHLYGQMADMDEIMQVAEEYGLHVIEDAAQAIGATYGSVAGGQWPVETAQGGSAPHATSHGPQAGSSPQATGNKPQTYKAGSFGDAGCFSFFPSKNLGAYGDGGMVVTNDDALGEKIRILRVHGSKPKYYHHIVGTNSRLDSIQAAILRAKLPHLDEWSTARRKIAARYDELLSDTPGISVPKRKQDRTHIFHQYTIRVKNGNRDALREYLKDHGIGTMIYYPLPLHLQECFYELRYKQGDLAESELASKEVLSLPVFPELTEIEQDYVIRNVKNSPVVTKP
jgi:dTDP-4-amino-4,6-dideoxygalactose transaminase